METKDISHVYSENELLEILNYPYQQDKEMDKLEIQLTAICKLCSMTDEQYKLCDQSYLNQLFTQSFSLEADSMVTATLQWVGKMAGTIYTKLPAFVDGVDRVLIHTGNGIKSILAARKNKKLSEEYLRERFKKITEYRDIASKRQSCYVKDAVEYEKQMKRFEGLVSICNTIVEMAESAEVEGFASDKIYDNLASRSNGVVKADEPAEGSQFRKFVWVKPYTRQYDFKKSEWMKVSSVNEMLKTILKVKDDAFNELEHAAKYIQKQCGNLKTEAEHVRKDNLQDMSVMYARTFMVSKCVTDIQRILLKEINWFVTSGIEALGTFDEERTPKSFESGKFNNK